MTATADQSCGKVTKNEPHFSYYAGPTAWNSLPDDIRQTTDTAAFKRQLKTHYFNLAFIT